jgi:hypothetical protein
MKKVYGLLWIFICLLPTGIVAQNAPVSTAGTVSTVESTITIPITAANFSNISSCNLSLNYDQGIATATVVAIGPQLGGNLSTDLSVPGKISLGWYIHPSMTLPGNPVLFNITFEKVTSGTSAITWFDDGYSCAFYDGDYNPLNDLPFSTYYINGALTFVPDVGISSGNGDGKTAGLLLTSSPNPFSGNVQLSWFLPEKGHVLLEIRNILGEMVNTLVDQFEEEGNHSIGFSSSGFRPGLYTARILLRTNNEMMTRSIKMIKESLTE